MACSNCKTTNCGCTSTYVVSATCPPSCSEVFNAQCIVYTGVDILCGNNTIISRNDYLDTVITKLVNFVCSTFKLSKEIKGSVGYTAGGSAITINHDIKEQYVNVRAFNNVVDVTSSSVITVSAKSSFTISNSSNNITDLLITG